MATGVLWWNQKRPPSRTGATAISASNVAACKNSLRQHVRPGLLVQQRRILSDGDLGIDHGFEQIVGDLDPSDRVPAR